MEYRFADRMSRFQSSAVRDILKLTQGKDIISFSGGLPAEEFFPKEALRHAFDYLFQSGEGSLQYGITEGYTPLREELARRMEHKGMRVSADHLLLTTGSQQAIDLVARVFLNDGDIVLTETPSYLAALQVFQSAGASIVGLPRDDEGILLEALEQAILLHRPKILYVIPTFANPTGGIWSLERRKQVLALCKRLEIMILEDDPYGELRFEDHPEMPTLLSLDSHPEDSIVMYTSTFSKTVVPALRTGWIIGDERIIRQLAKAKQSADLHSSLLDQQALYQLLRHFNLDMHIKGLRKEYESRMRLMADRLRQDSVWNGTRWSEPQGGMFFWLELPENVVAEDLLREAVSEGVAFVPGSGFYPNEPMRNTMRLNFSHSQPEWIVEGMHRLGAAYKRYVEMLKVHQ